MGLKFSRHGLPRTGHPGLVHVHNKLINFLSTSFYIRNLVSKKRRRMIVGGYDLDMTYITDRILAMSFPAERMRSVYRNPLWQVKSVLDMRHAEHYKVYNLCIEEAYDPSHFHGRVERFPFDDNHVPPLPMIKEFCEDVDSWLSSDPRNVAVIHCMAGKGRTGLMVSSYLVYMGMSAEKALQVYGEKRTTNNEGVSIPSQRRYVNYWEKLLSFPKSLHHGPPDVNLPKPATRELIRIRLYDMQHVDSVFCVVSELQNVHGERYHRPVEVSKSCCRQIKDGFQRTNRPRYYYSFVDKDNEETDAEKREAHLVAQMDTECSVLYRKTCLGCYYDNPVRVAGDVRIIFYEKLIGGRLFYACFNTAFIKSSLLQEELFCYLESATVAEEITLCLHGENLQFTLSDLDKVGKKGRSISGPAFCLELFFGPANVSCCCTPGSNDADVCDYY